MRLVERLEEVPSLHGCALVPTMGALHEGHASLTGPNDLAFLHYSDDVEEVVAIFGEAHKAWLRLRETVAWNPAGK